MVVAFLVFEANKIGLPDSARMVLTFAAVASLTVLALINEGRAGARGLELARLAMFGGLLWWGWTVSVSRGVEKGGYWVDDLPATLFASGRVLWE